MTSARSKKPSSGKRPKQPVHVLFDLAGRRWTLRAIWELRDGTLGFRALREACGDASPTVLSKRLSELRDAGLVKSDGGSYSLTGSGSELAAALSGLDRVAGNIFGF